MERLSRRKKIIYFIFSAMILTCVILVCNVQLKVGEQDIVVKSISSEEFSTLKFFNSHMEVDEKGNKFYIPDNEDPQVYLSVAEENINSVQVNFASALQEDTVVMLFYCKEGEGFAIRNITDTLVLKGEKKAILFMPEEKYAILRLDINGIYSIESIDLGIAEKNGPIFSKSYSFNLAALILLLFIVFLLMVFEKKIGYYSFIRKTLRMLWNKAKKIRFYKFVKKRYFSANEYAEDVLNARKTANCFAVLAVAFGVLFIYLVPPSSCPDEHTHFENICRISSGNLFADRKDGKVGSFLKKEEIDFIIQTHQEYAFDDYKNNKYSYFNNYGKYNYQNKEIEFVENKSAGINPMAYVSSVMGVMLIKLLLGISNPYMLLICAKISNLIFSVIIIRLAILKTPILRNTMFLLALMPMTIYQFASVSYDTEAICGSFLLFAYSMHLILSDDTYRITGNDIIAVCFSCICLFSSKIAYIPLIVILLAISVKKFGNIKKYAFSIFLVVLFGGIFFVLPTMISRNITKIVPTAKEVEEQRDFLFANLNLIPTILIRTFRSQKTFWRDSFVGVFGWVRIYLISPFAFCYFVILIFTALFEAFSVQRMRLVGRILSALGVFVVVSGTILEMYVGWTPTVSKVRDSYALGVQGRYFIPVAIFSVIWMANPLLCRFKYIEKINQYIRYVSRAVVVAYLFLSSAILLTVYWI